MKTEFLSEMLIMKSLVEDSVLNGARRDRRRGRGQTNLTQNATIRFNIPEQGQ